VIENLVISALPAEMQELSPERLGLVMNDVRNIASGDFSGAMAEPAVRAAAEHFVQLRSTGNLALSVAALALAIAGAAFARQRVVPKLRSRNIVESALLVFLVVASSIAI